MPRSTSARSYLRKTRRTGGTTPTGIAARAGLASRPTVDVLEPRQMLFALTLTANDFNPATGQYSRQVDVGYLIPYFTTQIAVNQNQPQPRAENFDQQNLGFVNSGTILQQSFVRVLHTITPANNLSIVGAFNDPNATNKQLLTRFTQNGQTVAFRVQSSDTDTGTGLAFRSVTFEARADSANNVGVGLDTDNSIVELYYGGVVVRSFTGAALRARSSSGTGVGTFTFNGDNQQPAFDQIRIRATGNAAQDAFRIDNLSFALPAGAYAQIVDSRKFAFRAILTGPIGATATFTDLYGRDMPNVTEVGIPQGSQVAVSDRNDDGIPDTGSDGIGRIELNNTDSSTTFTLIGGTFTPDQNNNLVFTFPSDFSTFGFEQPGFGFIYSGLDNRMSGLPPTGGTVIVGSPFVRPQNNYNPGGQTRDVNGFFVSSGFSRTDQGIVVHGNIGSINIPGFVFGSSKIEGSAERVAVGAMYGSLTVNGDLGQFVSATDAGLWYIDNGARFNTAVSQLNKTGSQLIVARTLGEVAIGGRSLMDVTVVGDLNQPTIRPTRDVYRYNEREVTYGIAPPATVQATWQAMANNAAFSSSSNLGFFRGAGQAVLFADGLYRNDTILGAEFVGNSGSGVKITGDLGGGDPANTALDTDDVYAFPAGPDTEINIQLDNQNTTGFLYFRIVDQDGRTLQATSFSPELGRQQSLKFKAQTTSVYYLVVSDPLTFDGLTGIDSVYSVSITGMIPVSLGAYHVAASSGQTGSGSTFTNTVTVLSGNVGSIRVATGKVGVTSGQDEDPSPAFNFVEAVADDRLGFSGGTFSIAGSLINVTVGNDFGRGNLGGEPNLVFQVGKDFGTLYTGLGNIGGTVGPLQGDVNLPVIFNIGGRAGLFDIRGAVGIDQDNATNRKTQEGEGQIVINTGQKGGDGSIGMFRTGSIVNGDSITINTSPGSTIGAYLLQQDLALSNDGQDGILNSIYGTRINPGVNSDVRFFDVPEIDLLNSNSASTPLLAGVFQEFVDDGGGRVRIRVTGNNLPQGQVRGRIVVLPVNGSQGVAIGRIDGVDLTGGATLEIESIGAAGAGDVISIGRIIIANSDAGSGITIKGTTQVDVWRIIQAGGSALSFLSNQSPLGDIVAADVIGLSTLQITTGDLGRTQMPAWGPQLIGPYMDMAKGLNTQVGGPLGVPGEIMHNGLWTGAAYRALNSTATGGATASAEDIGSPFDPYLNGIVVRTGDVQDVQVGGAVGDVILQGGTAAGAGGAGATGNLIRLTANFDRTTPNGRFDGIVGNIFAQTISLVNVGDGLRQNDGSPLSTTGIFAIDDIVTVEATLPGSFLSSRIVASNAITQASATAVDGIGLLNVNSQGGDFKDGVIVVGEQDDFWISFLYGDGQVGRGTIGEIRGRSADFFRERVFARSMTLMNLTDGFFDASEVSVISSLGRVNVTGYRNSTLVGEAQEFHFNRFIVGGDLDQLTTTSQAGDIKDLTVDITGSVLTDISARNIARLRLDVDNTIPLIRTTDSLAGSAIIAGRVQQVDVKGNIQTTTFNVAGSIDSVKAGVSIINSQFNANGQFGQIGTITAAAFFSGSVKSSGAISKLEVTAGDAAINVSTTNASAVVDVIKASRDLDLTSDIAGTVNTITAGRNIGNRAKPNVILVRGTLKKAEAGGQLYSDLRVGQTVEEVKIGIVSSRPQDNQLGSGSIISFGRIVKVDVLGDFAGDIISYSGGIGSVKITGGSFHPHRTISAFSGHIDSVTIEGGSLFGNVHADWILYQVTVNGTADGVFGDIGINPALSTGVAYDQFRNQLPVGVVPTAGVDGPTISAGWNVGIVTVSNGSIFETSIIAGRAIGYISVRNGDITNDNLTPTIGSAIVAGDSIYAIGVPEGSINLAYILAGQTNLGADNRPTGTGANHDTVQSGRINDIYAAVSMYAVVVSAGMNPGTDGLYNTADDLVTDGVSYVNYITSPTVTAVSVFSDSLSLAIVNDARLFKSGINLPLEEGRIDPGFGVSGPAITGAGLAFTWGADSGTVYFAGPGQAFWDSATGRVVVYNADLSSALTVVSNTGKLTDFDIVSNDDCSIGNIVVQADLFGDSDIIVDAFVQSITIGNYKGTGDIKIGGDLGTLTAGDVTGGFISANQVAYLNIAGNFGNSNPDVKNEAKIDFLAIGGLTIGGVNRGTVNVERDATGMTFGSLDNALVRSGTSIGGLVAGSVNESRISAGDFFGNLNVNGDVFDSQIMVGGDTGSDANFGGTGVNADHVRSGFMGPATIKGNFRQSDLVAGRLRGVDGFFGTPDDSVADGRSVIGDVTISGTQVGSDRNSESYRISSTGTIGKILIGGQPALPTGNFIPEVMNTTPQTLQVKDLQVTVDSQVYTARLFFSQALNFSTISAALSVSEVRGANQLIRLVEGVDYTISYDSVSNAALVVFARAVTQRNLPQVAGVPGPGIYRFDLDQSLLRAQLVNARLDGNGDGFAGTSDNFSQNSVVGDAGDKISTNRVPVNDPVTNQPAITVDFYGPTNLDQILDNNYTPDGLPDINKTFTIRGSIGDHPDNDTNYFRFAGDADLYTITLQAGQIVRLGAMQGSAAAAALNLVSPDGTVLSPLGAGTQTVSLPTNPIGVTDLSFEQTYLIKTTGKYFLFVGNTGFANTQDINAVANLDPVPSGVGDYNFKLQIYDDGDSGFSATTDAGNGTNLVNAPAPADFGTGTTLSIGGYVFTLDRATNTVSGNNGGSIASYRSGDGTVTTILDGSIGPSRSPGLPGTIFPDVDVYHLNNRLPITPGTRIKVTVRLNQFGSDLGSRNQNISTVTQALQSDYRGAVQFGVFQTSDSVSVDDAKLLFSPTAFSPNGGEPNTVIGNDGATVYGYDAAGDFYISFLAPSRFGSGDSTPATYAVYLQGVYQADYRIEVATIPDTATISRRTQNVLLEFNGGSVNWLQVAKQVTQLSGFSASILGYTGTAANNQSVDDYIKTHLRDSLQAIFDSAGLDTHFSFNPNDFEFQDFSTVYISNSADPLTEILSTFNTRGLSTQIVATQPYGFSQGSDPLNANRKDEAVVFFPSFELLGLNPSQQGLDDMTTSLTASVARRVGELLGLRITDTDTSATPDVMNSAAVDVRPTGAGYTLSNVGRLLSGTLDQITRSDFFLGQQNSASLLDKLLLKK